MLCRKKTPRKARTSKITQSETGLTVSLLHTGKSYPDDLTNEGVSSRSKTTVVNISFLFAYS